MVGTLAPPNQRSKKIFKSAHERTYQQANKSNDSDFVNSKPRKKTVHFVFYQAIRGITVPKKRVWVKKKLNKSEVANMILLQNCNIIISL